MDPRRFLELYAAETQEHLRGLCRSLLALERDADPEVIAEAFRAAHTIKGLSAAMGYSDAAARAHRLEDRLEAVRRDASLVQPALIDELLAEADALERDVTTAVATLPPRLDGALSEVAPAPDVAEAALEPPTGTRHILQVRLRPDAAIKAARALLVLRSLQSQPGLLGAQPDPVPDDFDGTLYVFLGEGADIAAAAALALAAGEVESAMPLAAARAAAPSAGSGSVPGRHVRVDEQRLDGLAERIGELSVLRNRLQAANADAAAAGMIDGMGGLLGELQAAVLAMRMVPLRETFDRLPRAVRDAARRTGKEAELEVRGEAIELDRSILNEIGDPLVHLVRNAVDHGIEAPAVRQRAGKPAAGRIVVHAERERSSVRIVLEDDGAGVDRARVVARAKQLGMLPADADGSLPDEEIFRLLSSPGFSTAHQVSEVSGRGVGLDAVVTRVRALGGAVGMQSAAGAGTRFVLRLPITAALVQALRVRVGGEDYAIPLTHITEALVLEQTERDGSREGVMVREDRLPLVRLRRVLHATGPGRERAAVVAELGERRAALAVDELVGHEQILVKGFDAAPGTLQIFSGATLLADGRPALVLDPLSVM